MTASTWAYRPPRAPCVPPSSPRLKAVLWALQQPHSPGHRDQGSGAPREEPPPSDSELCTIQGPHVLPLPHWKEDQKETCQSAQSSVGKFLNLLWLVKRKLIKRGEIPVLAKIADWFQLCDTGISTGYSGEKNIIPHTESFTLHFIGITVFHPPHFASTSAEKLLKMVSMGKENKQLLLSTKNGKLHPASVFYEVLVMT